MRSNRTLIWLFLAALAAPALDLVFDLDPNPSPLRERAVFPALHFDRRAIHFPGELTAYLKSAMGFRGTLVRGRALFAWSGLGVSPAPESVIRAEPWLFLRSEKVVEDFRRVEPFSEANLDAWRSVLKARAKWLGERGIRYLVVVVPNKESVYAEAVPPWLTRAAGPSRLEQLGQALAATPEVEFLDLSKVLSDHKSDGRLYHFTDTHWNDRGAFIAYQAIAARLRSWFPGITPIGEQDLLREARLTPGGDLARLCGLKNDLTEPQEQLSVSAAAQQATLADGAPLTFERMDVRGNPRFDTRSAGGEIPSAFVIRDSFGEALIPFLSRHLATATWIWTYDFPADVIDRSHPKLVIQELAERKLMVIEPSNPALVAASTVGGR